MDHLYFCIVIFHSILFANSQDPKINGTLGEIVGNIKTLPFPMEGYQTVHEYLGIPFAKPPIGDLRFRKPEPMTSLPSLPFYAKNHSAICPQITTMNLTNQQSEDCLYLNVYVPDRPSNKTSGHDVMVWVYGGGFQIGAANTYDFSIFSLATNIIVVTFNYRVGVFGFLNTGDDNARGNYGLWDQHYAFKWVHDNIEDFGGNKQSVTIAGESAGAMSVTQQALKVDNRDYFQRIIAQSGSMFSPYVDVERDGFKDVRALAARLECKTDPMDALMQCLRSKGVDDYIRALNKLEDSVTFAPTVDGDFIERNPRYIGNMSDSKSLDAVDFFRSLDMLSGFNANEGASVLFDMIKPPSLIETMQPTRGELRNKYLPDLMKFTYGEPFAGVIIQLIEDQYTNWVNPNDYNSIRLQIEKLAGDTTFGVPAVQTALLHKVSSASRNYMYHFAPKPSVRLLPTPSWVPGAGHADEIPFIMGAFGLLGVGDENAWENELILKMMTYWANFISSGDPNSPTPVSPRWPEYNRDTEDYLVLDKSMSETSAKQYFYTEEVNFWTELFPGLVDAVQNKGICQNGTFTSTASNLPVYETVIFSLVIFSSFTTLL